MDFGVNPVQILSKSKVSQNLTLTANFSNNSLQLWQKFANVDIVWDICN